MNWSPAGERIKMRQTVTAGVAMLMVAVVAACGNGPSESSSEDLSEAVGSMESLVEAAQDEGGTLVWYSAVDAATNDALVADFTERYGINVEVQRLATGPLLERVASEVASGAHLGDIIEVATPTVFGDEPDWFAPMNELPFFADYPQEFKGENNVATNISPWGVTYSTELVDPSEVPKTWTDLLDERWQGRILLTDVRSSPSWMAWAYRMYEVNGAEFLEQIASLKPELSDSASSAAAQVAAGAKAINFPATAGNSQELRDKGASIESVTLGGATSGTNIYLGVSANAPHPYAARLFAAYRMGPEAAQIMCDASHASAPLEQKDCPELPEGYETPTYGLSAAQEAELSEALGIS